MFKMKGVVPPVITPFLENGDVDFDGVQVLTRFLKDRVNGLFITGSYGSGVLLSTEERQRIAEVTIAEASGSIPIVVHVGTADSRSAALLARHAAESGASAVSAVGPFYYKHNADSICAFYQAILDATRGKVPVYVYNNPGFQGYPMDMNLLKRLKSMGVNGIKDATFDIIAHASYMRVLKDDTFDIALGTEAMWLSACVLGCEAFIPGLGTALPEICGQMYREGMARDYDKLRETQFRVNQLAVYAMLEIRGVLRAFPRSPFIAPSEVEKSEIYKRLVSLGVLSD